MLTTAFSADHCIQCTDAVGWAAGTASGLYKTGARFTKNLRTILQVSYNNAKVTINLRRTSNLQKHLTMNGKLFIGKIHLPNRNIVEDSVRKLAHDIPERNFNTF